MWSTLLAVGVVLAVTVVTVASLRISALTEDVDRLGAARGDSLAEVMLTQPSVPPAPVSIPPRALEVGPSVASSTPVDSVVDEREGAAVRVLTAWASGDDLEALMVPALLDVLPPPPDGLAVTGPAVVVGVDATVSEVTVPTTAGVAVVSLWRDGDTWLADEVTL